MKADLGEEEAGRGQSRPKAVIQGERQQVRPGDKKTLNVTGQGRAAGRLRSLKWRERDGEQGHGSQPGHWTRHPYIRCTSLL